ncbi:hypothetical protein [Citrobacter portucalensis]|uniref:hypothetical protein n=1 Tax=Citrobacter portucalensis TaxID=1639133 RepID=UPI00243349BC|nr:hypothetical protein [Citrobacter portucalensis]WFZ28067.1 hypothetical protein NFK62_18455 [Citrobacter portucalensis]WFZ33066.1 hypothetical protein NFK63_18445 [Citrobacter portucalensis]
MALSLLAANNAQTVLAAGISSTATSLTVNAGTGTLFPSPVAGTSFFKLTIIDAATGSLTEIVHVTARAGDVFTIQRGQEGTVPRAWSANDIAANMMTAGTLSYILGNFQPLDPTLTALAALVGAANKLPYFNGDDTAALTDLTKVGRDIIGQTDIAAVLQYLGLEYVAKTNENNTFDGKQTFTGGVSLPADTAYKGIGLQALFDSKQEKDDTLTALSGRDVAGLLSYLGLTSAAKTDAQNTFTQKQTFSGSVALPSDTTLNGTGLESLFDSKLDASKALGTGQNWVDVTASRTAGVTYTNTTTRPICVSIPETGDGQRGLYVGGVLTAFARGADSDSTLFAIVPPGAQYIFSGAFSSWAELR